MDSYTKEISPIKFLSSAPIELERQEAVLRVDAADSYETKQQELLAKASTRPSVKDYDEAVEYPAGSLVTYSGCVYSALKKTVAVAPTVTDTWKLLNRLVGCSEFYYTGFEGTEKVLVTKHGLPSIDTIVYSCDDIDSSEFSIPVGAVAVLLELHTSESFHDSDWIAYKVGGRTISTTAPGIMTVPIFKSTSSDGKIKRSFNIRLKGAFWLDTIVYTLAYVGYVQ